ncbi:LysR family transcriptional regulator [Actinomycetes bacterium KLBMP 9759]
MFHDLQINRLRALVTVVDLGGFRRAAEALHVTQPAVSQQIRQLSTLVKAPIFLSTGRDLQLSQQGNELLGYARRIVALNDEAVGRFLPPSGTVRFSLGVGDQLAEALPEILGLLATAMPNAQVSVRTGPSESLESQLVARRLDLGLLLQSRPSASTTTSIELGRIKMDWFGRPAGDDGSVLPLTLFTEPNTLRGRILDVFDASAVPWRVGYEGSELIGLRAATKAGLGVSCLVANGDELWGLRKTERELPAPPGPLPVIMAVSPGVSSPQIVRVARRTLQSALRGYPFVE